jgi:hypothetical protein
LDGFHIHISEALHGTILRAADESENGAGSIETQFEHAILAKVEEHLDALVCGGLPEFTVWLPDPINTTATIMSRQSILIDIAPQEDDGDGD